MSNRKRGIPTIGALAAAVMLLAPVHASAHCDGLDGPVVKAARQALATGDVNVVLPWVQKSDEAEIRAAFAQTVAVRALSPAARELADRWFFETLVRVHRAGEGAPYTGLKPAGRDLGAVIPAADQAVETGSLKSVGALLTRAIQSGLAQRFESVQQRKGRAAHSVEAARDYVRAYVEFLHFVERVHQAAAGPTSENEPAHHEH